MRTWPSHVIYTMIILLSNSSKLFPHVRQSPSQSVQTHRLSINFLFLKNLFPEPLICPDLVWLSSKSAASCYLNLGSLFITVWRIPLSFLGYPALAGNILQELLTKYSWEVNLRTCLFESLLILSPHLVSSLAGSKILGWEIILRLLKPLPPCLLTCSVIEKSSAILIVVSF